MHIVMLVQSNVRLLAPQRSSCAVYAAAHVKVCMRMPHVSREGYLSYRCVGESLVFKSFVHYLKWDVYMENTFTCSGVMCAAFLKHECARMSVSCRVVSVRIKMSVCAS